MFGMMFLWGVVFIVDIYIWNDTLDLECVFYSWNDIYM